MTRHCPQCSAECHAKSTYCASCGLHLTRDSSDYSTEYSIGTVVGSYRLIQLVGEGGMGRVFIAEHVRLGRKVALKMLRSEYAGNQEAVRRFFAEARAVNQISHENIIEISDFIENEDGRSYYIMELLRGIDLRDQIDREGAVSLGRAIGILVQVCDALAAAHAAGIVHRDLKPDNIFLTDRNGRKDFVKMLDFGVAKLMYADLENIPVHRTGAGTVIGTPEYMSPEQASGRPVDYRSDIYALGVIMYEMVTAEKPFQAPSFGELMIKHMTVTPPRPSKVKGLPHVIPLELEKLILDCLAKEPTDRPQGAKEIQRRLHDIARKLSYTLESFAAPSPGGFTRRTAVLGAVAALSLAIAALMAVRSARDRRAVAAARSAATAAANTGAAAATRPGSGAPAGTEVELSFDSTPTGAEVVRLADGQRLGATPLAIKVKAGPQTETFELRLVGHAAVKRQVSLQRDAHIAVALAAEATTASAPSASSSGDESHTRSSRHPRQQPKVGKAEPLDRSAVLNPFED